MKQASQRTNTVLPPTDVVAVEHLEHLGSSGRGVPFFVTAVGGPLNHPCFPVSTPGGGKCDLWDERSCDSSTL